jgi:hypothetical protein
MMIWSVVFSQHEEDSPEVEAYATEAIALKRAAELVMIRRHNVPRRLLGLLHYLKDEEQYKFMLDLFNSSNKDAQICVESTVLKGHPLE